MSGEKKSAVIRRSLFPKALGRAVEEVVKPACRKQGFAEHRILTDWLAIAGEGLAAWCLPRKLTFPAGRKDGGTLHVAAAPGRALEVQHMQPMLIERINAYFGYGAVKRITVTQGAYPSVSARKKRSMSARPSDPRAEQWASECADADMRRALLALGNAFLHKQSG